MYRSRSRTLGAICTASIVLSGASADAQHWHGGGQSHYQPGHFQYQPSHSHAHGGYYDHHPGWQTYYPDTVVTAPGYDGHPHDHHPSYPSQRVEYRFGGFSHIDDLASSLENQANLLCWELHYNYQHNPGYRATYREVYEMAQVARFIHGLEHARNRERIKEEVVRMDGLFHHIHRDMATWTGHHHRQVGHGGLTSKLEELEDTLHHLMDDVGVRGQAASGEPIDGGRPPSPADAPLGTATAPSDFPLLDRP